MGALLPFRQVKRDEFVDRTADLLIQEMMKKHAKRNLYTVGVATGFGVRALERGASFFEAMEIAEVKLEESTTQRVNEG